MDLKQVLSDRSGVDVSRVTLGRVPKKLGFSHIGAWPRHTLAPLPAASPELNAPENIRRYPRQTHLSNRVFENHAAILDACQNAWRRLLAENRPINSIASRTWVEIGHPFELWYYVNTPWFCRMRRFIT